ncbi:hypothetical protein [Streptomyces tropicalis]|uniref:Uncharacterized protein n=1 Tax=Streptomyces tropicalis TaxID=3034234 RepID=A0ABT6A678_9ACTN|nr:hypothetical protein [Streptomyces tropicalis]MDF3300150.1 hypothetical protein [Streptomyces tropicalis]
MPTLVLLVIVLLVLVGTTVSGALAYLSYRHPAARDPLLVGLTCMAVLAAVITPIVTR